MRTFIIIGIAALTLTPLSLFARGGDGGVVSIGPIVVNQSYHCSTTIYGQYVSYNGQCAASDFVVGVNTDASVVCAHISTNCPVLYCENTEE